jgi:CRISPR-associated exonuclease Cas4
VTLSGADLIDTPQSIPISALEHHAYCPRQAALIHLDGYFDSTVDTVRGDLAHAAVDRGGRDRDRHGQRVWNSLPVWSHAHGLHGICDVVVFNSQEPTPIEHKSGRYQPGGPADVQVAAQVLCLREMFDAAVPVGVVFSGRDRRRHEVVVDETMRARVAQATRAVRATLASGQLPPPVNDTRCRRCSLRPGCLPDSPAAVRHTLFTPRPEATWDD